MSVLLEICARKEKHVEERKAQTPLEDLVAQLDSASSTHHQALDLVPWPWAHYPERKLNYPIQSQ